MLWSFIQLAELNKVKKHLVHPNNHRTLRGGLQADATKFYNYWRINIALTWELPSDVTLTAITCLYGSVSCSALPAKSVSLIVFFYKQNIKRQSQNIQKCLQRKYCVWSLQGCNVYKLSGVKMFVGFKIGGNSENYTYLSSLRTRLIVTNNPTCL